MKETVRQTTLLNSGTGAFLRGCQNNLMEQAKQAQIREAVQLSGSTASIQDNLAKFKLVSGTDVPNFLIVLFIPDLPEKLGTSVPDTNF